MKHVRLSTFSVRHETVHTGRVGASSTKLFELLHTSIDGYVTDTPLGNLEFTGVYLTQEEQEAFNRLYKTIATRLETDYGLSLNPKSQLEESKNG